MSRTPAATSLASCVWPTWLNAAVSPTTSAVEWVCTSAAAVMSARVSTTAPVLDCTDCTGAAADAAAVNATTSVVE